jgi:hypothetical protein
MCITRHLRHPNYEKKEEKIAMLYIVIVMDVIVQKHA